MQSISSHLTPGERWTFIIPIVLICVFLYGSNINSFFLGDDFTNLKRAQSLGDVSFSQLLLEAFIEPYGSFYRPLQFLTYFTPFWVFGITPVPHHVIAIVLHITNSVLVAICARTLIYSNGVAEPRMANLYGLWAAVLFTVHPRHIESVGYSYTLENPLCGLFYIYGFYCFLRFAYSGRRRYLIAYGVCWLSSLWSKEMGVTLPILSYIYFLVLRSRHIDFGNGGIGSYLGFLTSFLRNRESVWFFGVTVAITTIYAVMRYSSLGVLGGGQEGQLDFSSVRMARTLIQSIIAMIVPNALPGMPWAEAFFREHKLLFIIFGIVAILLFVRSMRRFGDSLVWFSCAWCLISLIPILNLGISVRQITGNRFLYIPLVGFVLAFAVIFAKMKNSKSRSVIMVLIPVVLSVATLRNVIDMKSASLLAETALVDYVTEIKSDDPESSVLLVIPAMYKGIYVYYLSASFPAALSVFHGVEGNRLAEKIGFLLRTALNNPPPESVIGYIRDKGNIKFQTSGEDGFMWKARFYDKGHIQTVNLKLEDRVVLNSRGDFIARRASVTDQFGKVVIAGVTSSNADIQ